MNGAHSKMSLSPHEPAVVSAVECQHMAASV